MSAISVLLLILVFGNAATAQNSNSSSVDPCKDQVELYCKEESTAGDTRGITKCLMKNEERLSVQCKQELQRLVQASRQTMPLGGGPLGSLAGLTGAASQIPSLSYEGRLIPSSNETPSFFDNNLNISFPIYKTESETYSATLVGGHFHLSEPILLDSGTNVPTDFYRTDIGLGYSRKLSAQKTLGVRGTMGYLGDRFTSKTQSYSISANYSFPGAKENSSWVLMVMMSNNSPLGTFIPIPGFFYIYRTSTFTGLFGLPVASMQWTPVHPWSFSFSLFGPQIKAETSYGAIDKIQVYTGFGWKQQKYLVSERQNEDDRLTVEEKTAEIGLRKPLFQGVFSEIQAGYSFDRSIYQGEGLFNRDDGYADLDSSWYLKWSIKFVF